MLHSKFFQTYHFFGCKNIHRWLLHNFIIIIIVIIIIIIIIIIITVYLQYSFFYLPKIRENQCTYTLYFEKFHIL